MPCLLFKQLNVNTELTASLGCFNCFSIPAEELCTYWDGTHSLHIAVGLHWMRLQFFCLILGLIIEPSLTTEDETGGLHPDLQLPLKGKQRSRH